MVFSSFTFLFCFFPLIIGIYFLSKNRVYRNLVLLIVSLIFYACGEPIYVLLMILSTMNDFYHAEWVGRCLQRKDNTGAKKALISSVIINLVVLFFFKYCDFMIENINFIFHLNLQPFNLPLPIGISFYTFQSMSYTIDVYRGRVKVQESFLRLATYVALFPQLIAGPIVRYSTIEKELSSRQETLENVSNGLRRFIVGLMKKVLISNKLGLLATQIQVLHQNELSLIISWIGIIAYALHIYYDFSGYSDMAIGLGKMFGFHFLENFNYPYISKSMTEFWRRWHISLGSWFRDYVYIPLGGNRGTVLKHIRNILIVWFLTGFWHGASWNFILWGLYFGVILIIEKYVLLKWLERLPSLIQHIYAIVLFLIGWVIFSFTNLVQLGAYLKSMFDFKVLMKWDIFLMLDIQYYWPYLVVGLVGATPLIAKLARKFLKQGEVTKLIGDLGLGMLFVLCVMSLLDSTFNPFIYFRF